MIRHVHTRRLAAGALAALVACAGDGPTTPGLTDPKQLLWAVMLDHHAIALTASGDQSSIQVKSTPVNPEGQPLAGVTVVYSVSDSENVSVDANGLVTARGPAVDVQLVVTARSGNVTRSDTALLDVVDATPAPVVKTFTLSLASGAQTLPAGDLFGFFGNDQAMITATDDADAPIDGLPIYYTSSDPTTLTVDHASGAVRAIRPGTAVLAAVTTAFGTTKVDSLTITIGNPLMVLVGASPITPFGSVQQSLVFQPAEISVGVGGTVFFANPSSTLLTDVVFDDPTNVAESPFFPMGSGNVAAFNSDTTGGNIGLRARAFPVAGTYTYHSTRYNTNGRIIVQ